MIDPAKITNAFEWVDAYKNLYKNIIHGANGDLQVMDTEDMTVLAKTIPHTMGEDATVVLASSKNVELRAHAQAKQNSIRDTIQFNVDEARATFIQIENDLLLTVDDWTHTTDVAEKRNHAFRVGQLTKQLQDAESVLRSAMYPFRHTMTQVIPRRLINYEKKDDRVITVHSLSLANSDAPTRTITATDRV